MTDVGRTMTLLGPGNGSVRAGVKCQGDRVAATNIYNNLFLLF